MTRKFLTVLSPMIIFAFIFNKLERTSILDQIRKIIAIAHQHFRYR